MDADNLLIGLKRLSWLFAILAGIVTAFFITLGYSNWDDPDDYLLGSIIASAIAFLIFRIGIWVFKGFIGIHDADHD